MVLARQRTRAPGCESQADGARKLAGRAQSLYCAASRPIRKQSVCGKSPIRGRNALRLLRPTHASIPRVRGNGIASRTLARPVTLAVVKMLTSDVDIISISHHADDARY